MCVRRAQHHVVRRDARSLLNALAHLRREVTPLAHQVLAEANHVHRNQSDTIVAVTNDHRLRVKRVVNALKEIVSRREPQIRNRQRRRHVHAGGADEEGFGV